ncbi:MFS transporter [Conexibacter sp. JD483]|uniref:MFS transporter n=1 Tax=unclassified Conexibacter TaxID=2627773 RepID=UPI00272718F9|nr:MULTISPECIES: MFS transporter [unclassified Conexibacter]MDO8188900.1 MFS transporter [Conexibacter sp. CPCC 205706]MDO8200255.1 MFS transporter [Conexibacter sp. CPCC 205762]MDR9371624.1 MFS transporter [Conexibacter sp. JD483]
MAPSPSNSPAPPGAPARVSWMPLLAVCLGTFMLLVDVSVVNVALPPISRDLGASFSGLQWIVDAYALALAALLLLVGAVSDVVGRKRTYIAGLVVFTLASLACGLAPSEGALIAARTVQGAGAAAMFATTIALLHGAYRGPALGTAFGIWGATNGAAAAAGPIVGGLLTEALSWRWVFFVNVPIAIAAVVIARRTLGESRPAPDRSIDWAGGGAFTVAAALATFALVRADSVGWGSAQTLGCLAVALAALLLFVAIERRVAAPLFDLGLLRSGPLGAVLLAGALYSAVAFGALVYASIWLQESKGLGPIGAGLAMLPLAAVAFVVAAGGGRRLHAWPSRLVLAAGLALIALGNLLLAPLNGDSDWPSLLLGMAVCGLGVGAMSPTLASAALAAVAPERSGMAAGALNTARQLGLALGIAVLGNVYSSRVGSGHAAGSALGTTFLVAGIVGVIGVVLFLFTTSSHLVHKTAATSP